VYLFRIVFDVGSTPKPVERGTPTETNGTKLRGFKGKLDHVFYIEITKGTKENVAEKLTYY